MPDALDARAEIIERLKSCKAEPRARSSDAEKRAGAVDRPERAGVRIRSSAADRKPDEAGQGAGHPAAADRLRGKKDRKNTRLNSSHSCGYSMPYSARNKK